MISVPQIVYVLSCGFLLCLGPSPATEAHNKAVTACSLQAGPFAPRHGWQVPPVEHMNDIAYGGQPKGNLTIKDEVLRVEGPNDFVQVPESKEGRLRIDGRTPRAGNLELNEAKLKDQNYAYLIPSDRGYCINVEDPLFDMY